VTPDSVVGPIARALEARGRRFALVGGLAVSLRAEVRFTRDVDFALVASDDADVERLVLNLRHEGFATVAVVEDERHGRVAITRLRSSYGVIVDLLVASSGIIDEEIVNDASPMALENTSLPVARADDLLAMKVLSMGEARLQDRLDAMNLLAIAAIDMERVRERLRLITARNYHRDQDLFAKLNALVPPPT